MTRRREGLIGLKKIFFFITLIFLGTLILLSFALWQTARNQELRGHRQLVESVLKVAREPIAARDQIAIERVLQAFHLEGRNFRLTLPRNFEIIWPREHFNPIWDRKPDYMTVLNAGDGQILTVEYWVPHGQHEDMWPFVALALSFLLAAASIVALWAHLRRWRSDVTRIENYLLNPKAALEMERFHFDFFHRLASQITDKESEQEKRFESEKRSEKLLELTRQAAQVAHDIRSPLAALEVVSKNVAQLPEAKRILIRSAVSRIRDIANNLLDRQRVQATGGVDASVVHEAASPQLLSSLLDPVVSEKRLQFRSQSQIEIELRLDASSYGLFAAVQPVEFKRLVSNLVNNAVEAFGDGDGAVNVDLSSRDGRALVSVQDNGKGIPSEVLAKLGLRGETHGKVGGSGLGLYHARTSAESWGGSLEIASEIGKGTTTTVLLPLIPAPEWFVPELRLSPDKAVVILDDDASIHQVWQGRLDALKAGERGIEVVHVSSPDEIRGWVKGEEAKARQALYLFDYELLGYRETGLSLAEELALGERVVLVTSRYEEPEVLAGCRKLKARLIPKGLAGSVPMRVEAAAPADTYERERLDAVLIDDDPLTRMVWENEASDLGKRLRTFSTMEEFFKTADGIDRATPVYVDSNLGEGVEGAEESRRIHEMGFGEIYLATGREPGRFARFKHLRGVIGKEPPWGGA